MVAMSMHIKQYLFGVVFALLLILLPGFTYADTLPNSQTAPPTVSQCESGTTPDGAQLKLTKADQSKVAFGGDWDRVLNWASSWFGFGGGNSAGYFCRYQKGETEYVLFYDSGRAYKGAVDLASGQAFDPNGNRGNVVSDDKLSNLQKLPAAVTSCIGVTAFFSNFLTCGWRGIAIGIGIILVTLTAWLLGVVGMLFDALVYYTIDQFTGTFYSPAASGINLAWTAFRDLSNILIIGLFAFIAISLILGLKQYGDKKYIARLIIIAVFINFSLLFTKIIVDFSNFTASQFHTAATKTFSPSVIPENHDTIQSFPKTGIASQFVKLTGLTSLYDTGSKLKTMSETQQSGWLPLLHGVFAATLFLATAGVLLYGSYIFLVRAVLILVLLLTSALAFASYIIPNQKFTDQGWSLWWDSLIKSAVLAPLLMILLWATAAVGSALSSTAAFKGRTLGLADEAVVSTNFIAGLLNYLIILGLLFASFKISNNIASSVVGMSGSSIMAGATKVAGTFSRVPGLNYALGRFGFNRADNLQVKAKEATRGSGLTFNEAQAQRAQAAKFSKMAEEHRAKGLGGQVSDQWDKQARDAAKEATRLERLANHQDKLASRYGRRSVRASNWAASKTFSKRVKDRSDASTKAVNAAKPDMDKVRTEAEKNIVTANEGRLQTQKVILEDAQRVAAAQNQATSQAQAQRDAAQKTRDDALLEAAKSAGHDHSELAPKMPDRLLSAFKEQIATIGDASKRTNIENRLGSAKSPDDIKALREEITNAVSEPMKDAARTKLTQMEHEHESGMRLESARIEAVRNRLLQQANADDRLKADANYQKAEKTLSAAKDVYTIASQHRTEANTNEGRQKTELDRLAKEIQDSARDAGKKAVEAVGAATERVGGRVGARGVTLIPNILDRRASAAATVKAIRSKKTEEKLSDIIREMKESESTDTTPPPATGTST